MALSSYQQIKNARKYKEFCGFDVFSASYQQVRKEEDMAKFTVGIPYMGWKYYEVEAEDVEDAKEKVFEQNNVSCTISLCWHCSESIDSDFELSEKYIYVEEN